MSWHGYALIAAYVVALVGLTKPLGAYMARVYEGEPTLLGKVFGPLERLAYRLMGVPARRGKTRHAVDDVRRSRCSSSTWPGFSSSTLIQRLQGHLPLNPQAPGARRRRDLVVEHRDELRHEHELAVVRRRDRRSATCRRCSALAVQNFVSAASGMAVLVALIRGLAQQAGARHRQLLGRSHARHALHPLAALVRLRALPRVAGRRADVRPNVRDDVTSGHRCSRSARRVADRDQGPGHERRRVLQRELGASVREPDAALELRRSCCRSSSIPAALCYTFGKMVKDTRQGWAVLAAMFAIFLPLLWLCVSQEHGSPTHALASLGPRFVAGGNMEGKEVRFGIAASAL